MPAKSKMQERVEKELDAVNGWRTAGYTMATKKPRAYYSIGPSSFAYGYAQCKLCWRRQVVGDPLKAPYRPFPSVFGKIDGGFKHYFHGKPTRAISPDLAPGIVVANSESVMQSQPIGKYNGLPIVMRGKLDAMVVYDDGDVGIVDFKTANPRDNVGRYTNQLMAYTYMLEHPGVTHEYRDVRNIALHCFTPMGVEEDVVSGTVSIAGQLRFIPLEMERNDFLAFLIELEETINNEYLPPGEDCADCKRDELVGAAAVKAYIESQDDFAV
jgi:hypothetical protein